MDAPINEKIQALYDQAIWVSGQGECMTGGVDTDRFARLIIEECVRVVRARYMGDNNREDMEVLRCVEDLKKHFGL